MKNLEKILSSLLDKLSEYFAGRKGFLPLLGSGLIILNFVFKVLFPGAYLTQIDLFLHLGVVIAIFGLVLASAL